MGDFLPPHTDPGLLGAAAFDCSAVGMALLDRESRPVRVNRAFRELVPSAEPRPDSAFYLGTAAQAEDEARQRLAMLTGGLDRYECERRLEGPHGTVWLQQVCSASREGGRVRYLLLEFTDVTERVQLAAALRESEARFHHTFDGAALGIVHIDTRGRILRVNRRLCELHGYTRDELVGRNAFELMADHGTGAQEDIAGMLRGQWRHYTAERRFVRKNGEVYPARVSVSLARDTRGEPYFMSMVEDLSKQKADQRRLRQQAQMLDSATDAIIIHHEDRRIRYWNKGAERLFGLRAEQALGRTFAELLGPQSALAEDELARLMLEGRMVVQVECRTPDGRTLLVERRFTVVEGDDGEAANVLSVNTLAR